MEKKKIGVSSVIGIVVVIIVIIFLMAALTIVPAGHVGVVVLFGKVKDQPLSEGLHVINPLADVVKMEIRLQEYTMSVASAEGARRGDDAIDALTSEGLKIRLDLTSWYKLIPEEAPKVYREIGYDYDKKIIRPILRTAIRDVVVKFTAENIYSVKRDTVVSEISKRAQELVEGKGVILERILLRNIILPTKIQDAIDAKLAADQEARKMEFVLQKEEREKERKLLEAEGIRKANQIISQGLTTNYIRWYRIEMLKQLVNSPNNTIIIIPEELGSGTPLILNTN